MYLCLYIGLYISVWVGFRINAKGVASSALQHIKHQELKGYENY